MLSAGAQESNFGGSNSNFLSPNSSRKNSAPKLSSRRSTSSLRASTPPDLVSEAVNGRHSLAHELAVALMPEPSAGSKLLAEEFGIEYDEGAEGIDEEPYHESSIQIVIGDGQPSFADELQSNATSLSQTQSPYIGLEDLSSEDAHSEWDPAVTVATENGMHSSSKKLPEVDDMVTLAKNLESTDKFLSHLRRLDAEPSSSSHSLPTLEQIVSDIIRRLNDSSRDREGQLRELLGYEREFKQISLEVGGEDVLGSLDELPEVDDDLEQDSRTEMPSSHSRQRTLDTLEEEPSSEHLSSHDWETDPDIHALSDELDESPFATLSSPQETKDVFPPPPTISGPLTPEKTITRLTDIRSVTSSLISSLTAISENAQVNSAATSEAGRKIRALKNKMGGWRTDWDSAERSMQRIEKWEAGISQSDIPNGIITASKLPTGRVDGRKIVEEHLRLFEKALADAAMRTKAIVAAC